MAQTTIELRHLLQTTNPATGLPFELFDFEYEFDDVLFAGQLEQAVIDYYYFSEIGQETPERFKHVFKRTWLQMIGYYNRIHNIDLIEYDPLITYKMTETFAGLTTAEQIANAKRDGTLVTNSDATQATDATNQTIANNTTKTSNYPQSAIGAGFEDGASQSDGTTTTTSGTDTTTAADTTETTDALDVTTVNDTKDDTYTKTTEGFTGRGFNSVGLVQQYMESVPRLTGQVIDELKSCFMLVY